MAKIEIRTAWNVARDFIISENIIGANRDDEPSVFAVSFRHSRLAFGMRGLFRHVVEMHCQSATDISRPRCASNSTPAGWKGEISLTTPSLVLALASLLSLFLRRKLERRSDSRETDFHRFDIAYGSFPAADRADFSSAANRGREGPSRSSNLRARHNFAVARKGGNVPSSCTSRGPSLPCIASRYRAIGGFYLELFTVREMGNVHGR